MKVNITGKGIIPGLGTLAPVYHHEMTEREVLRLLNFHNIYVYKSDTGALITRTNITDVFADEVTKSVDIVIEPTPVTIKDTDDIVAETLIPDESATVETLDESVSDKPTFDTTIEENVKVTTEESVEKEPTPVVVAEVKNVEPINKQKFDKYNGNKKR